MSPEQKASKLLDIVDRIHAVQALVIAGEVVSDFFGGREADALIELLKEIADRLDRIATDLDDARKAA